MEHHLAMSSFGLENSHVTAIVGGGGKSSLMAALGEEYHRRGETVNYDHHHPHPPAQGEWLHGR